MPFKLSTISAALSSVSRSAASTITIPGGKGAIFTLTKVKVVDYPTLTTVVNCGAKVEVENDSVDYKPFEFITNYVTCVTTGAAAIKPTTIKCNKNLPAGSILSFYFTPYSTASQLFSVTINYELNAPVGPQNYSMASAGTSITQTTISSGNLSWTIPSGKGGNAISLTILVRGVLETVVNGGGLVTLRTNSPGRRSWTPLDFYIGNATVASCGGALVEPEEESLVGFDVEGQAIIYADYTPQDNQAQVLEAALFWEK